MSMEFCITAEGSDAGRRGGLQGMRGLDAAIYYRCVWAGPWRCCAPVPVRAWGCKGGRGLQGWQRAARVAGLAAASLSMPVCCCFATEGALV